MKCRFYWRDETETVEEVDEYPSPLIWQVRRFECIDYTIDPLFQLPQEVSKYQIHTFRKMIRFFLGNRIIYYEEES